MTAVADAIDAAIAIAKADAAVAALVGARVYGMELPIADVGSMPRACIVIRASGGAPPSYTEGTAQLQAMRFDANCYGATMYDADHVRRALRGAYRTVSRQVIQSVLVHWINPAGGLLSFRDPDTDWPRAVETWQILTAEQAAT